MVYPRRITAIMMLFKNTKVKLCSPDRDTHFFDIVAGILQRDTLALYLFMICLDYILLTLINLMKENGLTQEKQECRMQTTLMTEHFRQIHPPKTEYMCFNQSGDISILNGGSLKLVDKDADYADDRALQANTPTLLYSVQQAALVSMWT